MIKFCAEVFYTSTGSLVYYCSMCLNDKFIDEISLKEHLASKHSNILFNKSTKTSKNLQIKDYKESIIGGREYHKKNFKEEIIIEDPNVLFLIDKKDKIDILEESNDEESECIIEYTIAPALDHIEKVTNCLI